MKHLVTSTMTLALSGLLVVGAITGCSEEPKIGLSDQELELFNNTLAQSSSFEEACTELEVLCNTTGFGCDAHTLFCQVPTQEYICQQLAAACAGYPAACDVYNNHCQTDPPEDGGVPTEDTGVAPDTFVPPKDDGSVPEDGPIITEASVRPDTGQSCDASKIGQPCNPTANDCGNNAVCLPFDDTSGVCACECTPDNPQTPLIVEDSCPNLADNVCGRVPLVDGSEIGLCLKKCDPKLGASDCTYPISCNPLSGFEVGIYDSPVCLFPGCSTDDECPVLTSEECKTDGTMACTDSTAHCLPHKEGGIDGLCALPGQCDQGSGICAPRGTNFDAQAKIGDPCQDDTECGAAMACEREIDMATQAIASGACTDDGDCCSGDCNSATGQCVPGTCAIHSRNGYCYQKYCAYPSLTEYACPSGSVCNKFLPGGICQKSCTLDDATSCRGVTGDLAGDYECRSYNNLNQFFPRGVADGATCDWGDALNCSVFGIASIDCSFFGLGAGNDTNMRCRGLDGVDKTDPRDSTGFCLDDTASGTAWR